MKRHMFVPILLMIGLLAMGSTGCNSLFGGTDPEGAVDAGNYDETIYADTQLDLDDPNGGYDSSDEAPAFGDADFAAMFPEDPAVDDALGTDPAVTEMEDDPAARVYYLRLLWGQLRGNPEVDALTNWGGSISVDRGAIVVLRRLKFEPITDWVVFPREDEKVVDLYSVTSVHHDGLLLKIIDPTPDADTPNDLTIDMGPGQTVLAVADLDGYQNILDVDELGNQMSFQCPEILDCPNGFLHGIWVKRAQNERGVFWGVFTSYEGALLGHLRGHWGYNQDGERAFKGKYIGLDGAFRGILRGTWTPGSENTPGWGGFNGVWVDANEEAQGQLRGHYRRGFRRGGFFNGRWLDETCGM